MNPTLQIVQITLQALTSFAIAGGLIFTAIEFRNARKAQLVANFSQLVELQSQAEMLRALIHKTAWQMDAYGAFSVSDKVSMCNYLANRFCCNAADQAVMTHGGMGYSRHTQFEHIYRHHRRYRITEGSDEIQMRRIAGYMFGFMKQRAPKGVAE